MTSIKDDNTAERRSSNILSRVYQTVLHGSMGFSARFSGIRLGLGLWSISCLASQEISRLL
jgi:hypothetical protein